MLRPSLPADRPAIARLLTESGPPLDCAEAHLAEFVVAQPDGPLVGCAVVEPYGGAWLLRSVAVHRGARDTGMSTVVLLTTPAEGYFFRLGFRRIERAEAPAAVMALELGGREARFAAPP